MRAENYRFVWLLVATNLANDIFLLDWPADRKDQLEDLISIVFGQLEALALERVLFAPGEMDPPEFVRGLETAKRVSAALVRDLDSSARIDKREGISQ